MNEVTTNIRQTSTGWWFGTWILWLSIYYGNVIIPSDKYFSEGLKPPTSQWWHCLKQEFSEYPWSTRFFGAPRKRKEFLRQFCCKWRTRRTSVGVLNSCCCTGRMWEIAKHTTTFETIYGDFLNIPKYWGVPQIIKVIETHGMVRNWVIHDEANSRSPPITTVPIGPIDGPWD